MQDAIIIAAIITVFTALIAHYERRVVRLELQLDSALDELEKRSDLADEPPFNLVTNVPSPFTQSQIEEWN